MADIVTISAPREDWEALWKYLRFEWLPRDDYETIHELMDMIERAVDGSEAKVRRTQG